MVRLLTESRAQLNIQTKVNVHIMVVLFTYTMQRGDIICIIIMCGRKCSFLTHIMSYRKALLHSILLVRMATLMWWTLSSGQEPVSIRPAWYEDCCIIISYSSIHTPAFVVKVFFFVYHVQDGMTPLMAASINGHVEVVRALIGSQAQLNTQDEV